MMTLHFISAEDKSLLGITEETESRRTPKFDVGDTLRKKDNPAEWLDILNRNDKGYYVAPSGGSPHWVDLDYVEKDYEIWQEKD